MKAPELLAPAGSLRHLDVAFAYGADAVYAGLPRYSLRVRNNDFDLATLERGIATAHGQGKKFFLASNVMPHNAKVKTFMADMAPVVALGPDALIMADPGLIMLVRERWPELPIHLSVQANTVNYATVRFWQRQGVQRIILSRELSLEEVAEIRQQCPDMELEVFVHGAPTPAAGTTRCTTPSPTTAATSREGLMPRAQGCAGAVTCAAPRRRRPGSSRKASDRAN
jgi:putative protease